LVYYVGERALADTAHYADLEPEDDVELGDRDILDKPYKLLLRPGAQSNHSVIVAALGYSSDGQLVGFGSTAEMHFLDGMVAEWQLVLDPVNNPDRINVADDGTCVSWLTDSGEWVYVGRKGDLDCDGTPDADDCGPMNPNVHPGAQEDCTNGIDDDCDMLTDLEDNLDEDMDTFGSCDGDCDDGNAKVFPGATESCDGLDNDCNGVCDDGFDMDSDGVSTCGSVIDNGVCIDTVADDCDDLNDKVNPLQEEDCDGLDNDCSGRCDDNPDFDQDGDGYTDCSSMVGVCGQNDHWDDCRPDDPAINPGAPEVCDGQDNNCDGILAEETPCFVQEAGECRFGTSTCDETNGSGTSGACVEAVESLVGLEFCAGWTSCVTAADPDPWTCALDDVGPTMVDGTCAVRFTADGTGCPGDLVQLSSAGSLCEWLIFGGSQQMGYQVGFGADFAQRTAGCEPLLRVSPVLPLGELELYLAVVADDVPSVMKIRILPRVVDSCTNAPGLACDNWPAPQP
jgi:hypothetical protein